MPKRSAASTGARRELIAIDWADVGIRLVAYASWKAANLRWRTGLTTDLAGGKTPEDIAAEAVLKVVEGVRVWDPARGPLLPFLRGVVDSLMSHLAASVENRAQGRLPSEAGNGHRADDGGPEAGSLYNGEVWASSVSSDEVRAEDRIEHLHLTLIGAGKHDLAVLVEAVSAGCAPRPRALARALGTTVTDINNRLKRLRRFAHSSLVKEPPPHRMECP